MTRSSGLWRSQARRSGTTASITTSSTAKASPGDPVEHDRDAPPARPPGCDSVIATIGRVSAAAISIGVLRTSATRVLRASIPGA